MELLQLRYFCEVARRESVTKVAEELHVSQPSLSKTIKNLEQELGVVLFDRVKKRIVLNEQGKEFYDKVSKGLNLIDSAVDGLSVTPDSENGTISLIVKAGQCFFPPMYDLFCHSSIRWPRRCTSCRWRSLSWLSTSTSFITCCAASRWCPLPDRWRSCASV